MWRLPPPDRPVISRSQPLIGVRPNIAPNTERATNGALLVVWRWAAVLVDDSEQGIAWPRVSVLPFTVGGQELLPCKRAAGMGFRNGPPSLRHPFLVHPGGTTQIYGAQVPERRNDRVGRASLLDVVPVDLLLEVLDVRHQLSLFWGGNERQVSFLCRVMSKKAGELFQA